MIIVIPARGGSKGIPEKNIKKLGGKPLIQYTVEAAREIIPDNRIIVSTDSKKIKDIVEAMGLKVPFLRPAELATDTAGTREVLLHAVEYAKANSLNPNIIILLQPTSPFRNANHIKDALKEYNEHIDMVASVKVTKANPYFILKEEDKFGYLQPVKNADLKRRQDAPLVYELNGAIYIINVQSLLKKSLPEFKLVKKYVMDEESSLDIDTHLDLKIARSFIKNRKTEEK